MSNPTFTDIHCHPDLKTFLSANDEINRINCWQNLNLPIILKIIDRILLGNILESQSSLTQLNSSCGTIRLVGLYAFEKSMIKGDLFKILGIHVNLLTVAGILEIMGHHRKIDYELLKRISSPRTNYFRLFNEVQTHLVESETIPPGYNILNKINDHDPGMLNLIFTIEGGHNLFNKRAGYNFKKDVLSNLSDLKSGIYRYLFMGLAHLERNRLCTHAYGIKILHHRRFKPVGRGITRLGRKVIKKALSKPNRILIDIKHMSLEARKQYYEILKQDYGSENIPIIASHTGVTGRSYENMPVITCKAYCKWTKVQYYQPEGLMCTKFNPWSINLYDEEIMKIVDSDGLIGLNLDERILGTKQKKRAELIEYFSRKEFSCCKYRRDHPAESHIQDPEEELSESELLADKIRNKLLDYIHLVAQNPYRFRDHDHLNNEIVNLYNDLLIIPRQLLDNDIKHLCNNILHIVKVAGDKAWKHICIGSDFDGLINAVECCRDATKMNKLARELKKWLPIMVASNPTLSPVTNIDQKVEDIMSRNACDFLKNNFN